MLGELLIYLGYAMLSALVLIVVAKFMLQYIIRRPVDYYEKDEIAQEEENMRKIREAERNRHY
ncbi:MAG: hypothetical protein KBS56_03695 [Clostridiales bacterium]|nr:hypothetical protein [Candidatus Crickella equi]